MVSPEPSALRILHVEDNPDDRLLLKRVLDKWLQIAFDLDAVPSAREALNRLGEKTYDLILLDFGLPGMNGLEFTEELRRRGLKTPILFMSGRDDPLAAAMAMKYDAKYWLTKDGLEQDPKVAARMIRDFR